MRKNVLFVASVAKKHILQFHVPYIEWLRSNGYTVDVCAGYDFEQGDDPADMKCDRFFEIPFYRSPFALKNLSSYKAVQRLVKENHYELIHCHTPVAAAIARFALRKERKNGTKILYTAHGFHFYKGAPKISRLYYMIEKFLVRHTDAIITINGEDYEAAKRLCEGRDCKAHKINGIGARLDIVRNCGRTRAEMRAEHGIPEDAFLVMSNSEINENKNIGTSIKAVAKNEGVYYFACGTGSKLDEYRALVKKLGYSDRMIFAGYRNDAKELLNMADAFIFPSFREGLGLAAIEAMAAGLPLIASENRGTAEYAVNNENALLFGSNDVDGFAGAIKALRNDSGLCRRLGENGRKASEKYDLSVVLEDMENIYKEYLGIS